MSETSCLEAFCPVYTKMKVKCCFCPVVFNIINKPVAKEKVFAFSIRDYPRFAGSYLANHPMKCVKEVLYA